MMVRNPLKWMAGLAGLICGLVILGFILSAVWDPRPARLRQLKTFGYATNFSELIARYRGVPELENAMGPYDNGVSKILTIHTNLPFLNVYGAGVTHPLDQETLRGWRDYLHQNASAIQEIDKGLDRSQFRFPLVMNAQGFIPLPHFQKLGKVSNILSIRFRLAVNDSNLVVAVDQILKKLRLANQISQEPLMNSQSLSFRFRDQAIRELQWVLAEGSLDGSQAQALNQVLDTSAFKTNLIASLKSDIHFLSALADLDYWELRNSFNRNLTNGWFTLTRTNNYRWLKSSGHLKRDVAFSMDVHAASVSLYESGSLKNFPPAIPRSYFISQRCVPGLLKFLDSAREAEANMQLAKLALAIHIHHQNKGSYPSTLGELNSSPALSTMDPFTGQKFFYKTKAGVGVTIWSTGPDRKNEGGDLNHDIVFNLSRPGSSIP